MRHSHFYFLKTASILGPISIHCKRVRWYQSKVKNDVDLNQTFQLSTQRVELLVYDKTEKSRDPKGLSGEGIQWFYGLFDVVKKDRKANRTFIKTWLAGKKSQNYECNPKAKEKAFLTTSTN
jgi:hypothetical protein